MVLSVLGGSACAHAHVQLPLYVFASLTLVLLFQACPSIRSVLHVRQNWTSDTNPNPSHSHGKVRPTDERPTLVGATYCPTLEATGTVRAPGSIQSMCSPSSITHITLNHGDTTRCQENPIRRSNPQQQHCDSHDAESTPEIRSSDEGTPHET